LIKKHGKVKAFFASGNSSCCHHIWPHYNPYKEQCKKAKVPKHQWVIPRAIWKEMQ
ncbi:hypothetical protein EDB83DRAFT_2209326, partial [Lactarius deliciosus]